MSNTNTNEHDDLDDNDPGIRSLRAAADEGREAKKEADRLKRENAFLRAGVNIDSKVGNMLFKTYEGDLSDIEALKTEATEVGAITVAATTAPPVATQDEDTTDNRNEHQQVLRGGVSAGAEKPEARHPLDVAFEEFQADLKSGTPRENAALAAFDRVLVAGAGGDKRVIFNQTEWDRQARHHGSAPVGS